MTLQRAALAISVAFAAASSALPAGAEDAAPRQLVAEAVLQAAVSALDGEHERAKQLLSELERREPELRSLAPLRGLVLLLAGEDAAALPLLPEAGPFALYHAMAQAGGPGGLARARSVLVRRAEASDAEPGVLFLAALAFAEAGQGEKARALLGRAAAAPKSALDPQLAPDPANGLLAALDAALMELGAGDLDPAGLVRALHRTGRHRAALDRAASPGPAFRRGPRLEAAALAIWAELDPRRALGMTERAKGEGEAQPIQLELAVRLGDFARARRLLGAAPLAPAGHEGLWARAEAEALLDAGSAPERALEAAEEAARLLPKDDRSLWVLTRALLAAGQVRRARAFAEVLRDRRPVELDPYALLAEVEARSGGRHQEAERARSAAHRQNLAEVERGRARRRAVLAAVESAESGLGDTGLEALRGGDPLLALPIDLFLAKSPRGGTAQVARDRILAACKPSLRAFLARRTSWDRAEVLIRDAAGPRSVQVPLPAADPARCGDAGQRVKIPRRR